jgi:hypothetical protein
MKRKACFMALMVLALTVFAFAETKTVILQQGLDGYTGCEDKELRDPDRNYGRGPKEEELLVNEY